MPLNKPITLSRTIVDHDGFAWDVSAIAEITDGTNDAFDGGFAWLGFNAAAGALLSEHGREINVTATSLTGADGVAATRSIYVSDTLGYARFLDSFTNTTNASITFTYTLQTNLGSDSATTIVATGSGDTTFTAADDFLTTSDGAVAHDPVVTHYFHDDTGLLPASATLTGTNPDIDVSYSITLAAGQTKSLLSFGFQNATTADAAAQVADFQFSRYSYLEGLTLAERNQVQNFDVNDTYNFATEGADINLFDADRFLWDLRSDGAIAGVIPYDAFDGGFKVSGVSSAASVSFAENGREVNYAAFDPGVAGITGTRSAYISDRLGFARFLDSFTNTTAAAITFTYTITSNLGSDTATVVENTGSGDTTFTAADRFITTSDGTGFDPDPANGGTHDPFVTHYLNDQSGLTPTSATQSGDVITVSYSLTIDPGQTKSLLAFGFQNQDAAAATAQVDDFRNFKYDYLAGLTLAERATVVNFDVNAQHDFAGGSDSSFGIRDADNFAWIFSQDLNSGFVTGSAFLPLSFDIPTYDSPSAVASLTDAGREINATGTLEDQAGLAVARSVYVSDTLGYARFLDSFTNTTAAAITYTFAFNIQFSALPADVHLIATGSGDTVYQLADTFVSADDSADGNGGALPVGTLVFHDGTRAMPAGGSAATGSDQANVQYTFTIKAGETLSFLAFAFQNANASDATDEVNNFFLNGHQIDYYEGLSPDERARLMNFSGLGDTPTTGDNLIIGTPGDDSLNALAGHDQVYAGPGNDTVTNGEALLASENDFYDGGDGIDTLVYDLNWVSSVTFDLVAGQALFMGIKDTFVNFENITIGGEAQVIGDGNANHIVATSSGGANTLSGGGGNDTIDANGGDDTLNGDVGNDVLNGQNNNDTIHGGANDDTINAGPGNDTVDAGPGNDTVNDTESLLASEDDVYDGGDGIDTLVYGLNWVSSVVFDLFAGHITFNGVRDTFVNFENITLGGEAQVIGDGNANHIVGTSSTGANNFNGGGGSDTIESGGGNDTVDGGTGADTMIGGTGDDWYFVDNAGDVVTEAAGQGTLDRVFASASWTLTAGAEIENLSTNSNAGTAPINLTGNELANLIFGNAGNNTLDGKGAADRMVGLGGNDSYYVDNAGDVVTDTAGQGTADRVFAGTSWTLTAGAEIENLATTSNAGNAAINLTGNELANLIFGNAGNNILDGKGAADQMIGLGGNDSYYVDNAGDVVTDPAGQGTADRVLASVSWTLPAGAEIENLSTTSNGGTAAINLTGNERANTIFGNAGNNILDGKAGADQMIGLGGNDSYYVDNAGDTVTEAAGQGTLDRVLASVSWTLTAGAEIENLSTTSNSGTTAINLTGNEKSNTIFGNAGNNVLDGKAGADQMIGLGGNDSYYVDNAGDVVTDTAGQGTADRVFASTSWTLTAGAEIENLATTSNNGTAAIDLTGNELANLIYGNAGTNTLDGRAGADRLMGLAGKDTFAFRPGEANGDTVDDFAGNGPSAGDSLRFVGYGAGATFTQINATHWQVNYNGGASHDIITFSNAPTIVPSDWIFV